MADTPILALPEPPAGSPRALEIEARQDEVLLRLDELNHRIEALILAWMEREQTKKAA